MKPGENNHKKIYFYDYQMGDFYSMNLYDSFYFSLFFDLSNNLLLDNLLDNNLWGVGDWRVIDQGFGDLGFGDLRFY